MKTSRNYFRLHGTMNRNPKQKRTLRCRRGGTKNSQRLRYWGSSLHCRGVFASLRESFCFSLSVGSLVFILTFNILLSSQTFAQEKCETALAEAQNMYETGRFAQAIVRLNLCVPDRLLPEQRIGVYRLLAICYLNEDYREEARVAIRKIFDLKRQYEPDVQDSQPYRDLAAEVKAALPKPMSEKLFGGFKKWLWIGGGAAGVAATIIILQSKPEEKDLPGPPPLP